SILNQLAKKEKDFIDAHYQVSKLNKRLFSERMNKKEINWNSKSLLNKYTRLFIIERFSAEFILDLSMGELNDKFQEIVNGFPSDYRNLMIKYTYCDEELNLTSFGNDYIKDRALLTLNRYKSA
ncbi:hypothetical protein, partial [Photobacterium phosphoreum]|uniref:hypothetical protein n=1 Tax=Photobacterium phosphoreum TaxID=659 RepID=UPI000D4B7813